MTDGAGIYFALISHIFPKRG
jgi:predicted methyltransferase